MAFLRTASALVVQPSISPKGWGRVRTASKVEGAPSKNLSAQASEILGTDFDPSKYLLTHCTIVASVNVESVPNVKLGSLTEDGHKVNRKYVDYRVSSDTDKYINNNLDCFGRDVLLDSYSTFIGAQNYQEHVQVEAMSKGRIIDAVARDIGDSIYVDILVATDRKHTELVKDIEAGKLGTLSMGCSVDETICTKCGNVAVDETELCHHVRYEKGNIFYDDKGHQHRVAELCGHPSIEPHGGVAFIEASWVAAPAFTGAVLRNIIHPGDLTDKQASRIQEILNTPPCDWTDSCGIAKAASETTSERVVGKVANPAVQHTLVLDPHRQAGTPVDAFNFDEPGGDEGGGDEGGGEEAEKPKEESPLHQLEDDVLHEVVDRVKTRVREDLERDKDKDAPVVAPTFAPNDTLIKEARKKAARSLQRVRVAAAKQAYRQAYWAATATLTKTATSDADLVNSVAVLDGNFGINVPVDVYQAALSVGSADNYPTVGKFLTACKSTVRRPISLQDAKAFIRLGKILSHAEAVSSVCLPPKSRSV